MSRVGRLESIDAQLVLRDRYEIDHQIYKHDVPGAENPCALVLKHWCEDTITKGELYERMRQFASVKIGEYFNLSFSEFLEQPSFVVEMMIEVAAELVNADKAPPLPPLK